MSTQNLLVELFVEELPPKALKKLGEAFGGVLLEQLKAQGLAGAESKLTCFATPRRLGAHITAVAAQAPDKPVTQKLMPKKVAFDANGLPTPALLKKAESLGARCSNLVKAWPQTQSGADEVFLQADGKDEYVYFRTMLHGVDVRGGVDRALSTAIDELPIPKVMSYQLETDCELPGWSSVNFVRPAHSLIALHGASVVPVKALGLTAGNSTQGHRFEAAKPVVVIAHADEYAQTLAQDGAVVASFEARRAEIVRQLEAAAAQVGGAARPIEDAALLDEVTGLVERPNVLICEFEKQFLEVPQECLILTMKANQKYFPLLDAAGKLTNKFLVVSNINPLDASAVTGGNERVVRPRLADAKFFFDQDRKKTLESRVAGLAKVVYHNKLGTQGERMERVRAIAGVIVHQLRDHVMPYTVASKDEMDMLAHKADRAAQLAKTDLLTDMVGEFPELQGIMGGYYARHDGERDGVAIAIEDHYKPRFAGDELPRNHTGTVVALADKLETLVGMFGIGNLPTGDKDPFALRRHALGVIRLLIEKDLALDLDALLHGVVPVFGGLIEDPTAALSTFIYERLAGSLREQGYSAQEVDAVLALRPQRLADVGKRLAAVRSFADLPEAPALAAANKRVGNILKKVEGVVEPKVSANLLSEPAESALAEALAQVSVTAQAAYEAGNYTQNLQALAALKAPVDAFFDKVMVNAEDPAIRANRLGLLAQLHEAMNRVADLSKLAA
jgi:glycyl-tRNA synthetase beta chain